MTNDVPKPEGLHIPITDARLIVSGLPWFHEDKPRLQRLPTRLKDTFSERVWDRVQRPSGGRIRFRTDSRTVELNARADAQGMRDMADSGSSGFDFYVDGVYYDGAVCGDKSGKVAPFKHGGPWIAGKARAMRDITIYMPLYAPASIEEVILDADAKVEPPTPFALPKPVVYYGSSITQGGCASNSGGAYPAILSRWLNVDFVNLGLSGAGFGQESVAKAMTEIDCCCIVLDYWANPRVELLEKTLPRFVEILRGKFPVVPILVVGPYFESWDEFEAAQTEISTSKRRIEREFVAARRAAGDRNITFVDGLEMISRERAFGLVDGRHCNSAGFYFCAKGLAPHLRKALNLPGPSGIE